MSARSTRRSTLHTRQNGSIHETSSSGGACTKRHGKTRRCTGTGDWSGDEEKRKGIDIVGAEVHPHLRIVREENGERGASQTVLRQLPGRKEESPRSKEKPAEKSEKRPAASGRSIDRGSLPVGGCCGDELWGVCGKKREVHRMNNSKKRHDGGAWRRCETMIQMHCRPEKDRTKAKRHQKHKKKGKK